MSGEFHKPTKFSGARFEAWQGGDDPAEVSRVAHQTAAALISRVRDNPDPTVVQRLLGLADVHGIDAVAELWSRARPTTLPGALWRVYLLSAMIGHDPTGVSFHFQRGSEVATSIDPIVAGASAPTGPEEIQALADEILRGMFTGDFAIALDRAAAFCRVTSAGCASVADDLDDTEPERASALTTRALRLATTAAELSASSQLWRTGGLD